MNSRRILCRGKALDFSKRTCIMGILNVTPDSFSDGGLFYDKEKAVSHALEMAGQGADIIDIGGESTRPGADEISIDQEIDRVVPVIEALRNQSDIIISIDTYKSKTARYALEAGADIINDISGLNFDPEMSEVAAKYDTPVIIMHIKGTPKNMQNNPHYNNLIDEIKGYLKNSIKKAVEAGINRQKIIIDPGIGFGKSVKDNYIILNRLNEFLDIDCPVLMGVSRKSFIGKLLDLSENERIMGTAAAVAVSVVNGADIVRVHDVAEMAEVVRVADSIKRPYDLTL